jgi:hypothetical protein
VGSRAWACALLEESLRSQKGSFGVTSVTDALNEKPALIFTIALSDTPTYDYPHL